MAAIAAASIRSLNQFHPQDLSNTVWAFSTMALVDKHLLAAIAPVAISRLAEFRP